MVEQKDVGIQLSWVPAEAAANMGHLSESVENLGATSHAQNRVVHDQWRTIAEEISRSAVCLEDRKSVV